MRLTVPFAISVVTAANLLSSGTLAGPSEFVEAPPGPALESSAAQPAWWERDRMLGDVWGWRTPETSGIDYRLEWTQFYHGLIDSDQGLLRDRSSDDLGWTGKLDFFLDIDGQKAGLWPGLFINAHGEFRYGENIRSGGVLTPVNTAIISPTFEDEAFAFTRITVTQAFSESLLLTVGKFNTIDLFAHRFVGGRGTEGFMNTTFVAPPIAGRTVPISTLGAVMTVLHEGQPVFNLGILDSISPTTSSGFDGLSSDEITILADFTFRTRFGGRDGFHTISGTYSTLNAASLDRSDLIIPPEGGVARKEKDDSWQVEYLYEQYLTQDPDDPTRGWGVFALLGISDGNPNPIETTISGGIVANGVCAARPHDRLGIGLFYNEISNSLEDALSPVLEIQSEYGGEIFYDFAVTPWFHITADLQVGEPVLERNDTVISGGLRSRVIF